MQTAAETYHEGFRLGIAPTPIMTVSEYADERRILPYTSSEPGRWRTARVPFMREIMDNLSVYSDVEQTKLMKGTQIGGTEAGNNWACYTVDLAPCPMLVVLPTDHAAKDHAKQKMNLTFAAMPSLRSKIYPTRSRVAGSTMTHKEFMGGFLDIGGANTGVTFRHKSIRNLHLSDVDGYPLDVDGEGDPLGLAINRTDTFGSRKKIYIESTPTALIKSRIAKEIKDSDQRRYHIPCPACKKPQHLEWGGPDAEYGFKWGKGKTGQYLPETTKYMCRYCKELISEHHKPWMLAGGVWIAGNPGHRHRGYHLPSFYSPLGWLSWAQIVEEFLKADRNHDMLLMKRWVTTRKAEPYREATVELKHNKIFGRREDYGGAVPMAAQVVVASVDTQDNRLEVLVDAYGPGRESWGVEHIVINGDPVEQRVWDALDKILIHKTYLHESGRRLKISLSCIDSAGHRTKLVYDYVREREAHRIYATKGSSQGGKSLVSKPSTNNLGKVKLYFVGTDTAKELIYASLGKIETPGPGYIHFNMGFDEEWFKQLTSETYNENSGKWELPLGLKNEALDLKVLSLVAHEILNPDYDAMDTLDLSRRVFYGYEFENHSIESYTLDERFPIAVCCDFNKNPLVWVFCQIIEQKVGRVVKKKVVAFDELSIRNCNTVRMGVEVQKRYGGHGAGFIVYGSPRGAERGGGNRSDYALLGDLGFFDRYRKCVDRLEPTVHDRVNAVNNMFEDVSGRTRLLIGPKCVSLLKGLERAIWCEDGTEIERIDAGPVNAADALGHFIAYEWPLSGLRSSKRTHWK